MPLRQSMKRDSPDPNVNAIYHDMTEHYGLEQMQAYHAIIRALKKKLFL